MAPKTATPASHPKFEDMIKVDFFSRDSESNGCICLQEAIISLKEKGGSSRQAIKKYISSTYHLVEDAAFTHHVNAAISTGVDKKVFLQPKGPSGAVKVSAEAKAKIAKPKAAAPAKVCLGRNMPYRCQSHEFAKKRLPPPLSRRPLPPRLPPRSLLPPRRPPLLRRLPLPRRPLPPRSMCRSGDYQPLMSLSVCTGLPLLLLPRPRPLLLLLLLPPRLPPRRRRPLRPRRLLRQRHPPPRSPLHPRQARRPQHPRLPRSKQKKVLKKEWIAPSFFILFFSLFLSLPNNEKKKIFFFFFLFHSFRFVPVS